MASGGTSPGYGQTSKIEFLIVLKHLRALEEPARHNSTLREAFSRVFSRSDTSIRESEWHGTYQCVTYVEWPGWSRFLDGLTIFRSNLMEREILVEKFVFANHIPMGEEDTLKRILVFDRVRGKNG